MISAHDVARELRDRLPDLGIVKLHKLLYYCQAWFLAWAEIPMFREQIEAWDNGPVVADLWHDEDKQRPAPQAQDLTNEMLVVLGYVVSRYGHLSGRELIDLTHAEPPWQFAYEPAANVVIWHEDMTRYFRKDEEIVTIHSAVQRVPKDRLQAAVEAISQPSSGPITDGAPALEALLQNLA
jgi:uncharacterized phage-associated protein